MPRTPYVDKNGLRKGPWSKEEDDKLRAYIERYGHWNWREIPRFAGVSRCGKSCRLRWMNYLRPNIKHGNFTKEEEDLIMELHNKIGNKWATIATELPGRSDNEIKNYWHTHLKKRANKDQNVLKNVNCETKNVYGETLESSHLGDLDEVEALWASLSTESLSPSSYSSSVELTSSMFMASDCLVSSGDSLQRYNNEYDGNFWTEPFFADYDGMRSTAYSSSDSDVVNNVMVPDSCHDMTMNDEFVWSTMDLYSEYHGQFM